MTRKSDYLAPIPALFADATPGRGLVRQAITGLSPNLKRFEVTFVRVGEKVVAEVPTAQVEHLGLRVGSTWSEQLAKTCAHAKAVFDAKDEAVRLLEIKPRTRGDLVSRIKEKGIAEHAVTQALTELSQVGLYNEAEALDSIARSEWEKGSSLARVREVLRDNGVDANAAEETVLRFAGKDTSEVRRAREVAKDLAKKLGSGVSAQSKWRKLLSALERRGFDEEASTQACRAVLGKEPGDDDRGAVMTKPRASARALTRGKPVARKRARVRS